jgi:phosphotransferase system enzyme I (PtsI)
MKYAEKTLRGIGVSQGIAIAPTVVIPESSLAVEPRSLGRSEVAAEHAKLDAAVKKTGESIRSTREKARRRSGSQEAAIFDVHLALLQDPMLVDRARELIAVQLISADYAIIQALQEYRKFFARLKDDTFQDRLVDVKDVSRRLIETLQGRRRTESFKMHHAGILVAHNLTPSETINLDRHLVLGLVTEMGSTSASELADFLETIGEDYPFMPAFAGNAQERRAAAAYIASIVPDNENDSPTPDWVVNGE